MGVCCPREVAVSHKTEDEGLFGDGPDGRRGGCCGVGEVVSAEEVWVDNR